MPRTYQPKLHADGTPNERYQQRTYNRKGGKHLGKFTRGKFVAWDGEGITNDRGVHKYVMLLNSEHASMVNVAGLHTLDCLAMLCAEGKKHRNAIHVVFGGSYDVNMILTNCSKEQIARVWAGEWVRLGPYLVNYRPRKSFTVKHRTEEGQGLVLWDVFGFFQSSFVEALKKYLPTYEHTELITKRKAERHDFHADSIAGIIEYCSIECDALVALMQTLRDYLATASLKISRWDGAGACAAALLKREGILAHKAAANQTPAPVLLAAQHAYAGGRTELLRYGHDPRASVFHYDINSAYPAAMRECPSLSHGRWERVRKYTPGNGHGTNFSLYHVVWNFDDGPIAFPFFWRAYDAAIYYPRQGSGWYWSPEIDAAFAARNDRRISGDIRISEGWQFVADDPAYPFQWIDSLFEQRKQWKAAGIGAEKVVKLAINSLYGKTAQHLGGTADAPPRYHQLEWAGYITSKTRATLYRALMQKPDAGIMMATDAIYSLEPLDLPTGDKLGEWSGEVHDGITIVQSGVYWTDNNGKAKTFCRGFDKGSLKRDGIVSAWSNGASAYNATLTRFVTMGSALPARDFRNEWQRWKTSPRALALSPFGTKRTLVDNTNAPHLGLVLTQPAIPAAQIVGQKLSAPYPLPWSTAGHTRDTLFDGAPLSIIEQEAYDATL